MSPEQHARWEDFALRMARLPRRRRPLTAWVVEMVEWFFALHDHPKYDVEDVTCWDHGQNLVCDRVAEFLWDRCDWSLRTYGMEDDQRRRAEEQWLEQWGGAVSCCIRAGLDVVAEPSMGVIGFTVGDLRSMYPEGLPAWLDEAYEGQLAVAPDDASVLL